MFLYLFHLMKYTIIWKYLMMMLMIMMMIIMMVMMNIDNT